MSYLDIKNLSLKLGKFELKDINLSVEKGEFVSIIGRSGSGKTILLESMAGLHKVDGKIILDKADITHLPPQSRHIGIVYQDYMLFPNMSVKKNILYPTLFYKDKDFKHIFEEVVGFLNIEMILDRGVKNLSGGEKQKVAIARALLSNPKLLLLDEPLNAVDLSFKFSFMEFLKDLHKRYDLTILYVTHNFKEALFFGNRCVVMLDGKICQNSSTNELFKHPKSKKVAEFLGFKNILPAFLIGEKNNKFFSVSPDDIEISKTKPNKDFVFEVAVGGILKIKGCSKISVSLDGHKIFINTKTAETFDNSSVYIGFNKQDIGVFN